MTACKNPFVEFYQAQTYQDERTTKVTAGDSNLQNECRVTVKLNVKTEDLMFVYIINDLQITIWPHSDYDEYRWFMSDSLVSSQKECVINLKGYAENVYPLVLYAGKSGTVYSGLCSLIFDGNKILVNSSQFLSEVEEERTVFPKIARNSLQKISLSVKNNVTGETVTTDWSDSQLLEKNEFTFPAGTYTFQVTAAYENLCLNGCQQVNLEKGSLQLSLPIVPDTFSDISSGTGNLSLRFKAPTGTELSETTVVLYKKETSGFVQVQSGALKNSLFSVENLAAGVYWFRVDALSENGDQACYQIDYVYILDGLTSEKTVSLNSFYDLYSVTFILNGGFLTEAGIKTTYSSFDKITLPDSSMVFRPGYAFDGWFYDEDFGQPVEQVILPGQISSDVTLYARWRPENPENVAAGCGLLEKSQFFVEQKGESFIVKIPDNGYGDYFLLKIIDSEGKEIAITYNSVYYADSACFADISFQFSAGSFYMVEVLAYKNKLSFRDVQIFKTLA